MIERHVQTIFCDDIRQEVNGKLSFIGVYSGRMYVRNFPATLSKLCLAAKIVTPADKPLYSLTLYVLKDEETLQEIAVDEEQLATVSQPPPEDMQDGELENSVQQAQFLLVFSPIKFDRPCVLRVRAQTEDGELRGLALKVERTPEI